MDNNGDWQKFSITKSWAHMSQLLDFWSCVRQVCSCAYRLYLVVMSLEFDIAISINWICSSCVHKAYPLPQKWKWSCNIIQRPLSLLKDAFVDQGTLICIVSNGIKISWWKYFISVIYRCCIIANRDLYNNVNGFLSVCFQPGLFQPRHFPVSLFLCSSGCTKNWLFCFLDQID